MSEKPSTELSDEEVERAYDEHAEDCPVCCVLDLVWCEVGAPLYAAVEAREKPQIW